jgi:hypothetical protein
MQKSLVIGLLTFMPHIHIQQFLYLCVGNNETGHKIKTIRHMCISLASVYMLKHMMAH